MQTPSRAHNRTRRIPVAPKARSLEARRRRKVRGQAAVIIALCSLTLLAIVGLAVDGGAMFVDRRAAQNASDAAALAAARTMLTAYDLMLNNNSSDVDGTYADDQAISQTLYTYAAAHGIARSGLQAYYVNDDKQVVTSTQVGMVGRVPWTLGAKGIGVNNRALSDSFFMKIFGWAKVGATASSVAFMGITTDSSDVSVLPIGLFTSTLNLDNIRIGQTYTLLSGEVTQGSGNWGWVDFNGQGSAQTKRAWIDCGFNPSVSAANWTTWCTNNSYSNANGWGPAQHFVSASTAPYTAAADPSYVPFLVYGAGADGWWLAGATGTVNSNCRDFEQRVGHNGGDFTFPVLDAVNSDGGSNTRYHLRALFTFFVGPQDVSCHSNNTSPPPTVVGQPTPTPTPNGSNNDRWFVQGTAKNVYQNGSTGRHGDLRHTSGHVVFLEN